MIRRWARTGGFLAVLLTLGSTAHAQVVQSLHLGIGGFFPRGLGGRSSNDVIRRNIVGEPLVADPSLTDAFAIDTGDFKSALVFGEWIVAIHPNIEISGGVSFYGQTVPSLYRDLIDDQTLEDIEQTIKLRVLPITALVRFVPFGTAATVQPYVGVGVSFMRFHYSEVGEFVDPLDPDLVIFDNFDNPYEVNGWAVGPVLVGGLRIPLGGDVYAFTVEAKYQFGSGNTGGATNGFVADKIDLGGTQLNAGILIRF